MHQKYFHPKYYILFLILLTTGIVNTFSQILTKDDILLYEDIVYTVVDGHELKLDIAFPKYLETPTPVIVDIPGGAWRIINKSSEDAIFYATYGFIGVSIILRTSDIAIFPAAVHDCKTVIRWLRAHAEKYHIDPEKIGVTGFSSGGHLALLLGTSAGDDFLEGDGDYPDYSSSVQAVVDHFGPTDFMKMNDTTGLNLRDANDSFAENSPPSLFLGGPLLTKAELAGLANPVNYIDLEDPPIFIGHGEKDGMVIIKQSELLFEALKDAGVPTKFIRVKNAGHMYHPYKWDVDVSPSVADMNNFTIQWFEKWLGKPTINIAALQSKEKPQKLDSSINYPLYYKLTLNIPGKNKTSYCKGRFLIKSEGKIFVQGEINLSDLSTEEKRTFQQKVMLSGVDLSDKEILWNFQGEIFDSVINQKFESMYMQGVKFDNSIVGVGFHIYINEDTSFNIEKKVYRR